MHEANLVLTYLKFIEVKIGIILMYLINVSLHFI